MIHKLIKQAKRICFLGKGGIGKSVIVSNLSEALTEQGYHVLQIGNDISLCSTLLLRGTEDVKPVLESYRTQYDINLEDFILQSKSGVFLMELGGIEPGVGCLARGIHHVDELLENQGILENYKIDYILYDIAGEIPCTGYILPIRDGIIQKNIVITTGDFSSLSTANSILAAITGSGEKITSTALIVNNADEYQTRALLNEYHEKVNIPILTFIDNSLTIKNSYLEGKTIFEAYPNSKLIEVFRDLAKKILELDGKEKIVPFGQKDLLYWQREWKNKAFQYNSGFINIDFSQNI